MGTIYNYKFIYLRESAFPSPLGRLARRIEGEGEVILEHVITI
jgi:hypothetical protein